MIFKNPERLTHLDIWTPRYSDAYGEEGERVALLAQYKVAHASPWIIVTFTRAKHLAGQRFCIKRVDVEKCKVDSNGSIPCYAVPMSAFEHWDTAAEVVNIANKIFP